MAKFIPLTGFSEFIKKYINETDFQGSNQYVPSRIAFRMGEMVNVTDSLIGSPQTFTIEKNNIHGGIPIIQDRYYVVIGQYKTPTTNISTQLKLTIPDSSDTTIETIGYLSHNIIENETGEFSTIIKMGDSLLFTFTNGTSNQLSFKLIQLRSLWDGISVELNTTDYDDFINTDGLGSEFILSHNKIFDSVAYISGQSYLIIAGCTNYSGTNTNIIIEDGGTEKNKISIGVNEKKYILNTLTPTGNLYTRFENASTTNDVNIVLVDLNDTAINSGYSENITLTNNKYVLKNGQSFGSTEFIANRMYLFNCYVISTNTNEQEIAIYKKNSSNNIILYYNTLSAIGTDLNGKLNICIIFESDSADFVIDTFNGTLITLSGQLTMLR